MNLRKTCILNKHYEKNYVNSTIIKNQSFLFSNFFDSLTCLVLSRDIVFLLQTR